MALRLKTVEYVFDTRTTNLATATTLAAATRHDFASKTLYVPENSSRTFKSVILQVTIRDGYTTATSVSGWRLGIKLGAAAFSDTDTSVTLTVTADHTSHAFTRDVTSYFVTNFGSGTSQTAQVGVAFSTAAASNVNVITAKLFITYEYDDASQNTRVKTVKIPLEGNTAGTLTNSLASIGSNQVPALDSFLEETTKVYRQIWFELYYNDAGNATTGFFLGVALDAESEAARATLAQGLNSAVLGYDIWIRDDMTTNAAHDFKARASVTTRIAGLSVILHVTYEYSHTSSTSFTNSIMLAAADEIGRMGYASAADQSQFARTIKCVEPGTLTLKQSGVLCFFNDPAGFTLSLSAGSQTPRSYTVTAGSAQCGGYVLCHRIDSGGAAGAGMSIARGDNEFKFSWYTGAANTGSNMNALLILNYSSSKAANGDGTHNHTIFWSGANHPNTNVGYVEHAAFAPEIPETNYWLTGMIAASQVNAALGSDAVVCLAERKSGEGAGDGWEEVWSALVMSDSKLGLYPFYGRARDAFKRYPKDQDTDRLDIETSRKWRLHCTTTATSFVFNTNLILIYTYHSMTWTVSGNISGNAGSGNIVINLIDAATGARLDTQTVAYNTTSYSFTWYDNTRTLAVEAYQDATHVARSSNSVAS